MGRRITLDVDTYQENQLRFALHDRAEDLRQRLNAKPGDQYMARLLDLVSDLQRQIEEQVT